VVVVTVLMGAASPVAGQAASRTFPVRSQGAVPDDGVDDGPGIRAAIAAAKAAGPGATVTFEPGRYDVRTKAQLGAPEHLLLQSPDGLALVGDHTELVFSDPEARAFSLNGARNTRLSGLTIDYATPPFTQGFIDAVDPSRGTVRFRVADGFPGLDHPMMYVPIWGTIRDPATGLLKHGVRDHQYVTAMTPAGAGVWDLTIDPRNPIGDFSPGDGFALGIRSNTGAGGVVVFQSSDVTLSDLTVYTAPGAAVLSIRSDATHLVGSRVVARPGTGRWLSTTGDAFHQQAGRRGPVVSGNVFSGMADDGVNIYGVPNQVRQVVSARQVVTTAPAGVLAGDTVDVFDPVHGVLRGTRLVSAISAPGPTGLVTVTLDKAVRGMVAGPDRSTADQLYDRSNAGAGYEVSNNVFRDYRGRGVLARAGNGVISGNQFTNISGIGIAIQNDPDVPEGPMADNVTVADNVLAGVAFSPSSSSSFSSAAISVRGTRLGYELAASRGETNITLTGNHIVDPPRHGIYLGAARAVRIRGTTIDISAAGPVFATPTAGIMLENSAGVAIDGVSVTDAHAPSRACVSLGRQMSPKDLKLTNTTLNGAPCIP
jgi:hypothetical protein